MKNIFVLACLFVVFQSNAQSIDILESKNGFKSLKINSHISKYKYNLEFLEKKNGHTTYKYVDGYEIVNETKTVKKKISIYLLARQYKTKREIIEALNPNLIIKGVNLKKNQTIIVPVRKKLSLYSVDKSLLNLFGEKINSINLTFENNSNKLKKISLNLNQTKSMLWLNLVGYKLKELYTKFEDIIGQSTEYPKPSPDCYKFKNQSCFYFDDRVYKGEILWKSSSIVLMIYHDTDFGFNDDGTGKLIVNRIISFEDKSYYNSNKMSGF